MKKFISIFLAVGLLASMLPPVSYAYDSYYASLTDSSYTGSDTYVVGSFSFPEGIASIVIVDFYNACGEMTTDFNDPLGFEIYYSDQSPQPFYIPINSSEDCYYNSNYSCLGGGGAYPYDGSYSMAVTVYEWNEYNQAYDDTPAYSNVLYFDYNGGSSETISCGGDNGPVCGDGTCGSGETCTVDNCCGGAEKWLDTDEWNCGSCGVVCSSDETCEGGVCTPFNSSYCGDAICSLGETCSADNCCSGVYANTNTDPYNCGLCGTVCSSGQECKLGLCKEKKLSYDEAVAQASCDSEDCEKAQQCIIELDPYTGCLMEFADVIPLIDKPVALTLLADDICALKERTLEQKDPIGIAVKSVLMVVDVADNIPDTVSLAGYVISVPIDIVEGIIDCLEGLIYD
jgi:hypothetical protein